MIFLLRQKQVQEEGCKGETGTVRVSPANKKLFPKQHATGGSPGAIQRRIRWSSAGRNASAVLLHPKCFPITICNNVG
jgi:hypothetical protein